MSLFSSHSNEQPATVEELQADARADYEQHNSTTVQAAAREQVGQTRTNAGVAAGSRWGR
jgi:hypothetical protein